MGEEINCIFVGMDFGDKIERIINRLVIPEYKDIDFVVHKKLGSLGSGYFYEFIFVVKEGRYDYVDFLMKIEIMGAAETVIAAVGSNDFYDYSISFRSKKNCVYKL